MTSMKHKDALSPATHQARMAPPRKRGPQPGTASAQHGEPNARAKYGHDYFALIGRKGGLTLSQRRGPDYFAEIGRHGGETTNRVHGVRHYSQMGKLSSQVRKQNGGDKRPSRAEKTAR
jgi:uncharacterized protein